MCACGSSRAIAKSVQQEERAQGRKTIKEAADEFLEAYKAKHRAPTFAEYKLKRVVELLGDPPRGRDNS